MVLKGAPIQLHLTDMTYKHSVLTISGFLWVHFVFCDGLYFFKGNRSGQDL